MGYGWRRPRHTLKGRRDAAAVDRAGLRLKLLRQRAAAGDIRLLFGDEAEAPICPYLAHCWAEHGADLRVEAPGQARRRALPGVPDHARGELIVLTSATKRSSGPRAQRRGGSAGRWPWRSTTARSMPAARRARPWLTVERLPKYAPELNAIERSWRDLKRHHFAHRTFRDADQLDAAIRHAVAARNRGRRAQTCAPIPRAA